MSTFTNPLAPIDYGHDYNFFKKVTVSNAAFNTNCDVLINMLAPTYTAIFTNLSSTGTTPVVEYSLNGQIVHGELGNSTENISLTFQNRVISKIWFRLASGSSATVSVQAWAIR